MDIPLNKLQFQFEKDPILVGGKAMEYYGLRNAGEDIDLIAHRIDIARLVKLYPDRIKNLWGDLGVCPLEFEIWKTIFWYDYDFYQEGAQKESGYLVISPEKLLFMKSLAMEKDKNILDVQMLTAYLKKGKTGRYDILCQENEDLLKNTPDIHYIEKTAPDA